jgi:hypothetical protein
MPILVNLYYDLTCQDLVPEFEDRHETFFAEGTGYFMQLMVWDPPQLQMEVGRSPTSSLRLLKPKLSTCSTSKSSAVLRET